MSCLNISPNLHWMCFIFTWIIYQIYIWILYRKPWTQIRIWIKTLQCALRDHDWNAAKRTSICPQCYNSCMVWFSATTLVWSSSVLQLLYGPVHCYIQLLSSPAECYVSCPTTALQLLSRPVQWFYSCPVQFSASSLAQPSPTLHSATTVAQSFSMHLACAIALKYDTLHHRLL